MQESKSGDRPGFIAIDIPQSSDQQAGQRLREIRRRNRDRVVIDIPDDDEEVVFEQKTLERLTPDQIDGWLERQREFHALDPRRVDANFTHEEMFGFAQQDIDAVNRRSIQENITDGAKWWLKNGYVIYTAQFPVASDLDPDQPQPGPPPIPPVIPVVPKNHPNWVRDSKAYPIVNVKKRKQMCCC